MNYVRTLLLFAAPCVFSAGAGEPPPTEQMALGKQAYASCALCHGADGKGAPAGPLKMAPPFSESKLLMADDEVAIALILKGIAKEDAKYVGIMAPLGATLDDAELAAVLTYVRNSFGNEGPAVSAGTVKAVRAKYTKRAEQWRRAELKALAEKLGPVKKR